MKTTVRHSHGQYEVEFTESRSILDGLGDDDLIVTDDNVRTALNLDRECFSVKPGEQSKSLAIYGELMEWLALRAHRSSRIVALGGGVVGDLAGFAAATYMRGVRVLQVPTSLMAMVDSSIGGKVGIDLVAGKNLAGALWPPERVLVPLDALKTLSSRHFINGAAEVWKYAAIMDPALFGQLSEWPLAQNDADLAKTVMRCIEHKKTIVEEDEHETSGRRAILNFGHTVGHAIEQAMGYREILHGEAVSIGMVAESLLGEALGVTDNQTTESIRSGLQAQGLPTRLPEGLDRTKLLEPMRRDKKADRNGLAFSLVSKVGNCKLMRGVAESDVVGALEKL